MVNSKLQQLQTTTQKEGIDYIKREDIRLIELIGSGYVGEVYKAVYNHKTVVVKKLTSNSYNHGKEDDMLYSDLLDELHVGYNLHKNQHLIQFYGYSFKETSNETILYIVMEHFDGSKDLGKYIYHDEYWTPLTKQEYENSTSNTTMYHENKYWDYTMDTKSKLIMMKQACLAIDNLHKQGVVHCDIKPGNMLYDGYLIKLIDFNASVKLGNKDYIEGKKHQGTPGYMPIEMYNGRIGYSSDIYSIGVSMLEMWFGDIWPQKTYTYKKTRKYVLDYLSLLKQDNESLYNLIKKCTNPREKFRPTLDSIINTLDGLINQDRNQSE